MCRHEAEILTMTRSSNRPDQFDAVHPRHRKSGQNEAEWSTLTIHTERFLAIRGALNLVAGTSEHGGDYL